ncbi:MAG: ChbG/HpnK family deacetylase, partial [Bacteroidota bacterium]
ARRFVRAEWRAQIYRFTQRWGRLPSHLDSHQHVALIPGLMRLYVELAAESGIHALRAPREVRDLGDLPGPRAFHRLHETLVLSQLAERPRGLARRAGVSVPDSFAGFRQSGRMDESALLALLPRLGERGGIAELMVHPGSADAPGGYARKQERDALMSPRVRAALAAHGLQLGRFSDLP